MSLKDSDSLVRRYAMVNVQNYQVVAIGEKIAECTKQYVDTLKQNNIKIDVDIDEIENATNNTENEADEPETELLTKSGAIDDIRTAVINGNSVYYISLAEDNTYFAIKASDEEGVVILNVGDTVTVSYEKAEGGIVDAESISK